jgi:molybdate transport system substrate-binding protein
LRLAIFLLVLGSANAAAAEVHVAVAANFVTAAKHLAEPFLRHTGHRLVLSSGSTGKFYAQIKSGAPFEVLLSADDATPRRLEEEGFAVAGTRFTYATGRLVLWSARPNIEIGEELLRKNEFQRLAIANPKLAPYGAAAQEVLERLGLWATLRSKLVHGENIAQTFQFVSSGNAELGFVALSQVQGGSRWLVPASLHAPLKQDAVLLARGKKSAAAASFLEYLRTTLARKLILSHGYE